MIAGPKKVWKQAECFDTVVQLIPNIIIETRDVLTLFRLQV